MLMIMGATFTGVAAWLVLAEAGIAPGDGRWARSLHVIAAVMVVLGLSAPQGEFTFGVPQFQAIFAPILVSLAAAGALVAGRLVLGRGWMLGIVTTLAVVNPTGGASGVLGDESPVETRRLGLYVASAAWVELVARVLGTDRRTRFALASGAGIGTVGLAGEWLWNQGAKQPWETSLLPDAVLLAMVGALGAALVAAGLGAALRREAPTTGGLRPLSMAAGALAIVAVMAVPMPRHQGDVTVDIALDEAAPGEVFVEVEVAPGEVDDHRWFQTLTWQHGSMLISEMVEVEPGLYHSEHAHPVSGLAKTMLRLHRGGELMSIPIHLPADPEIGAEAIPAVDREGVGFEGERAYLLREARDGDPFFSRVIYGVLFLAWIGWAGGFALAASRIGSLGAGDDDGEASTIDDRATVSA